MLVQNMRSSLVHVYKVDMSVDPGLRVVKCGVGYIFRLRLIFSRHVQTTGNILITTHCIEYSFVAFANPAK